MTEMGDFEKKGLSTGVLKPILLMHSCFILSCMLAARAGNPLALVSGADVVYGASEPGSDIAQATLGIVLVLACLLSRNDVSARRLLCVGSILSAAGSLGFAMVLVFPGFPVVVYVVLGMAFGAGTLLLYAVWGCRFAHCGLDEILVNLALAHVLVGVARCMLLLVPMEVSVVALPVSCLAGIVSLWATERVEGHSAGKATFVGSSVADGERGSFESTPAEEETPLHALLAGSSCSRAEAFRQLAIPLLGVVFYSFCKGSLLGGRIPSPIEVVASPLIVAAIVVLVAARARKDSWFFLCYLAFPLIASLELLARSMYPLAQIPIFGLLLMVLFTLADVMLFAVLARFSDSHTTAVVLFLACRTLVSLSSIAGSTLGFLSGEAAGNVMLLLATAYFLFTLVSMRPSSNGRGDASLSESVGETAASQQIEANSALLGNIKQFGCDERPEGSSDSPGLIAAEGDIEGEKGAEKVSVPQSQSGSRSAHSLYAHQREFDASEGQQRSFDFDVRIKDLSGYFEISPRESEVFALLARGYGSPYIAKRLFVSENTARSHIKAIYRKTGVGSRDELIELVHSDGYYLTSGEVE